MCNSDPIDSALNAGRDVADSASRPVTEVLDKTVGPVGDSPVVQDVFKSLVAYTLGEGAVGAITGATAGAGSATTTTAAADATGTATEGVTGTGGGPGGSGLTPGPGEGEPGFAGESAPGATEPTGNSLGGKDVLGTLKALAPAITAGSALVSAMSAAAQAKTAKDTAQKLGNTDLAPPAIPDLAAPTPDQQSAIDPDLTVLRKKNALLFGLDSPGSTDITKGTADTGSLGRITLLGGTSKLSS